VGLFNLKWCYDDGYDERMMMNECNVAVERLKFRETRLGFSNWGLTTKRVCNLVG